MPSPVLVLASASPARLTTLQRAGIRPRVHVADLDEAEVLRAAGELTPHEAVLTLARAKAEQVAARPETDGCLVLGCDSMLELDGTMFGKPRDAAEARSRWHRMRGRSGTLRTGHWIVAPGAAVGAASATTVRFADVTDAEIDAYVASGEPLRVAGAFTIDGLGAPFVTGVDGDHHGVVGLSLPLLRELLARLGISITELWRPEAPL